MLYRVDIWDELKDNDDIGRFKISYELFSSNTTHNGINACVRQD